MYTHECMNTKRIKVPYNNMMKGQLEAQVFWGLSVCKLENFIKFWFLVLGMHATIIITTNMNRKKTV